MNVGVSLKKILGRDKLSEIISLSKENSQKIDLLSKESSQKIDLLSKEISAINSNFSEIIKQYRVLEASMGDIAMKIPNSKFEYINSELLSLQKTDKRKILIVGFYGAPNLGDELMLETLLQYLQEKKDIEITIMLCDNPDYDIRKYQDVNFIHYPRNMFDINYIAGYFDTVIFGGGAIIDDTLYDKINPNYSDLSTILIDLSAKCILRGKKIYCIGLSSNTELRNKDFLESLSLIIKNARHFSLRDENSIQTLKKAGIDIGKVLYINDITLANKDLKVSKVSQSKEFKIGLNLICDEDTFQGTKDIFLNIKKYLKNNNIKDYSIDLIPFYSYKNNDKKYYSNLNLNQIESNRINILEQPNSMADICKILSSEDIVICMRYHCAIISLALGIPTLAICYDKHNHYPNKMSFLNKLFNVKIVDFSNMDKEIYKDFDFILQRKSVNSKDLIYKSQRDLADVLSNI